MRATEHSKMPLEAKIAFTIGATFLLGLFLLINPKANNAGPDWFWRVGNRDTIRNLICRPDGSFRPHIKLFFVGIVTLWLLCLWFLVPSV